MSTNEYFVVLPSNACPKVHPDNHASKFIVSWENPLEVDVEKWSVALTEMSYNFAPSLSKEDLELTYSLTHDAYYTTGNVLEGTTLSNKSSEVPRFIYENFAITPNIMVSKDAEEKYVFQSSTQFEILSSQLKEIGIKNQTAVKEGYFYFLRGTSKPTRSKFSDIDIYFTFPPITETHTIKIPVPHTTDQLLSHLHARLPVAYARYNDDGRLEFQLKGNVTRIKLHQGLHRILGSKQSVIEDSKFIADYVPQLNRGIDHMYVYASCCATTRVGDVKVPLLRNIFIEDNQFQPFENPYGKTKNFIIRNPMYLPIASTSINSIEVNIRDDSGRLISFDEGAKTSLTLHFKRND